MNDAPLLHFPVGRMSDRVIKNALKPYVERAIEDHPGASIADIAEAACRVMDPDGASPAAVREGCKAALERIARELLPE